MTGSANIEREQDQRISAAIVQEESRLRSFIRRRIPDPGEVEDALQDVFHELVVAYRLMKPIERVGAWLFRVAQKRITDRFRKRQPEPLLFEGLVTSNDVGTEGLFDQSVLLDEPEDAIGELTEEQRQVFLAHEVEGVSFAELATETGLNVNTLLSRKHAAVQQLRRRLRQVYDVARRRDETTNGEEGFGDRGDRQLGGDPIRPGGAAFVKLVDARDLRLAAGRFLAGAGADGTELDPVWHAQDGRGAAWVCTGW